MTVTRDGRAPAGTRDVAQHIAAAFRAGARPGAKGRSREGVGVDYALVPSNAVPPNPPTAAFRLRISRLTFSRARW